MDVKSCLKVAFSLFSLQFLNVVMNKRRRLLEENNVLKDFGGRVPKPLFRYLKVLGENEKSKENFELWGYQKILEYSKAVSQNEDIIIILGQEKSLSSELGKYVFLVYSKECCPDSLILVTHEENGDLVYHSSIDFKIL